MTRRVLAVVAAVLAATTGALVPAHQAAAAGTLLSQGRPATASSVENAGLPASAAVDGNPGTRWSSAFSDPQWIQVDLGGTAAIDQVVLNWEAAYATGYRIQVSADGRPGPRSTRPRPDRWRADPHRHRHRPVRADVRHRPGHRLRVLAVGVRGHTTADRSPAVAATRRRTFWGDTSTIPAGPERRSWSRS